MCHNLIFSYFFTSSNGSNNSDFHRLMLSLWAGEALALAHWGRSVIPKKTHSQSVLSTETPYYPRIRPISRSVFLFFVFFSLSWWLPHRMLWRRIWSFSAQQCHPAGMRTNCGCSLSDGRTRTLSCSFTECGPASNSVSRVYSCMQPGNTLFTSLCADKIPSYEYARKQSPREVAGQIH